MAGSVGADGATVADGRVRALLRRGADPPAVVLPSEPAGRAVLDREKTSRIVLSG